MKIVPARLQTGDQVRIIAPSRSMGIISESNQKIAIKALQDMGLRVTFGNHVEEYDIMHSSSIGSRLTDLHEAFADPEVKAILSVIGGFNANQLLDGIDYSLIRNNPKIFCGFSDITVLLNALYHKTSLITYSGIHFSSCAMQKGFEYSRRYFEKIMFLQDPIIIQPSDQWADDAWFLDQDNRKFYPNNGYTVIQSGQAAGTIIGGHLGTLMLLAGTEYMPSLEGAILFLESDAASHGINVFEFDRLLQSLVLQPGFKNVVGIVIGRFEHSFGMTDEILQYIIATKPELRGIPVVANVDFGHTTPIITFPIGGWCQMQAEKDCIMVKISH